MWQPWFCYPLIVFVSITLPMYQVLHPLSSCPMLPYFFYFILLLFINNHQWWCWFLVLSLKLWLHTSCQKILIENVVNHLFFWKLQFKCSWSNVLRDFEQSVSFIIQLLWGSIRIDILVFQPHMVSNLQSLRISSLLVKLFLHVPLCFFHCFCRLFPASL